MTPMLSSAKSNRLSSVFSYQLRRYKSIWILYTAIMFLTMPFAFFLAVLSTGSNQSVYVPDEILFHLLALGMSVGLPLILFHYINYRQAVDVFHALPVSRKNLFWGTYLSGLTMLLVPYVVFGAGTLCLESAVNHSNSMDVNYPLLLMAMICLYSTMVFIMINCGTLFESIVYFGIIHLGYPLFIYAGTLFVSSNTYGYSHNAMDDVREILYSISPVCQLLTVLNSSWESNYPWWRLLVMLAVSALSVCAGAMLYRRRKSESAGQSFAYIPLFYIGSLLISITIGLGFALSLPGSRKTSSLFGILLGLITYFILDTIRNRGFRKIAHTALVGGITVVLATTFFVGCYGSGTFGFETRVPAAQRVKAVSVSWNISGTLGETALNEEVVLTDAESIEAVCRFHETLVANMKTLKESYPSTYFYDEIDEEVQFTEYTPYDFDDGSNSAAVYGRSQVKIQYTLKNGTKMYREYTNCPFALTKPLSQLAQSEGYQQAAIQWLSQKATGNCNNVSLYRMLWLGSVSYDLTIAESDALMKAVQADVAARQPSEQLNPSESPLGYIVLSGGLGRDYWSIALPVFSTDHQILSFMAEKDYEFPRISADTNTEVAYLSKEKRATVMSYPERNGSLFFCAGLTSRYGTWIPEAYMMGQEGQYVPDFYELTDMEFQELLSMVAPCYLSETPYDVVLWQGSNYLVYPQYEEAVRTLIESGTKVHLESDELLMD